MQFRMWCLLVVSLFSVLWSSLLFADPALSQIFNSNEIGIAPALKDSDLQEEREFFVTQSMNRYKKISLDKIMAKKSFSSYEEVEAWVNLEFDKEVRVLKADSTLLESNKVIMIRALYHGTCVGFLSFEILKSESQRFLGVFIRQYAVKPGYENKGVEDRLISIIRYRFNPDEIILLDHKNSQTPSSQSLLHQLGFTARFDANPDDDVNSFAVFEWKKPSNN